MGRSRKWLAGAAALMIFLGILWAAGAFRQTNKIESSPPQPHRWAKNIVGEVFCVHGHGKPVRAVALSPDNRWLASGGEDRLVRIWDLERGERNRQLVELSSPVTAFAFHTNGQSLIVGSQRGTIDVVQVDTGETVQQIQTVNGSAIEEVASSPNSDLILSRTVEGNAYLWNVGDQRLVARVDSVPPLQHSVYFEGNRPRVIRRLRGVSDRFVIWDVEANREAAVAAPGATWAAWAPAVGRMATWNAGRLNVWETGQARPVAVLTPGADSPSFLALTNDGKFALVDAVDHGSGASVRCDSNGFDIWDVEAARRLRRFDGHEAPITCVAFSQDGRALATAGLDGTVRVWALPGPAPEPARPAIVTPQPTGGPK